MTIVRFNSNIPAILERPNGAFADTTPSTPPRPQIAAMSFAESGGYYDRNLPLALKKQFFMRPLYPFPKGQKIHLNHDCTRCAELAGGLRLRLLTGTGGLDFEVVRRPHLHYKQFIQSVRLKAFIVFVNRWFLKYNFII